MSLNLAIRARLGCHALCLQAACVSAGPFGLEDSEWLIPANGLFIDAPRWTAGVPGAGQRAVIDALGASYRIEMPEGLTTLGGLVLDSPGAMLTLDGPAGISVLLNATLEQGSLSLIGTPGFANSTITSGLWTVGPEATLSFSGVRFSGATVLGDVELDGALELGRSGAIIGTIRGSGEIGLDLEAGETRRLRFGLDGMIDVCVDSVSSATLRFDADDPVVFEGRGIFAPPPFTGPQPVIAAAVVNEGWMGFAGGGEREVSASLFENRGEIWIEAGTSLWVEHQGRFDNAGGVIVNEGLLEIGRWDIDDRGEITNTGEVQVYALDGAAQEFRLEAGDGRWLFGSPSFNTVLSDRRYQFDPGADYRVYGMIKNATVEQYGGFASVDESEAPNDVTLDGVVFEGDPLRLRGQYRIEGDVMLPENRVVIEGADSRLSFGPGRELTFDIDAIRDPGDDDTGLTIGTGAVGIIKGVTVRGEGFRLDGVPLNHGTIRMSGRLTGQGEFVNDGLIEVAGGWLSVFRPLRNNGTIFVEADGVLAFRNFGSQIPVDSIGDLRNEGLVRLLPRTIVPLGEVFEVTTGEWLFGQIGGGGDLRIGPDVSASVTNSSLFEGSLVVEGGLSFVTDNDGIDVSDDLSLGSSSQTYAQVFSIETSGLMVEGVVTLGGSLTIDLCSFSGEYGDVPLIAGAGGNSGMFSSVEILGLDRVSAALDQSSGVLTVEARCGVADMAEPIGTLDLADITAFIDGVTARPPSPSDFNGDLVVDLEDITIFVLSFTAGCQ